MQQWINKATNLIEALPYIRRFSGKIFVIKCGGAAMTDPTQMHNIMQDIALLHFCGIHIVIIHGGGPDISAMCDRLQLPIQFCDGQRVTDANTMEIVQMVLVGKTNRSVVMALNQLGVKATGISGHDTAFIQAEKFVSNTLANDLGFVGNIVSIDATLIDTLLAVNFVPVIAPVGVDATGQAYNINADIAAGTIAGSLNAEKLIVLSDVNGFYEDIKDSNTRLNSIEKTTVKAWLQQGKIEGGMIPKLQSCINALDQGVPSAHLLDGKMPHSLLLEIFTDQGVGTLILNS
ncbi:acetylglutamate kinase [soil metagenome]